MKYIDSFSAIFCIFAAAFTIVLFLYALVETGLTVEVQCGKGLRAVCAELLK